MKGGRSMAILSGFWAGVIIGFLLTLALIFIISIKLAIRKQKSHEDLINFINSIKDEAKEKVDEVNN